MKKIILWTVILDTATVTWQRVFMFKPEARDLIALVKDGGPLDILKLVQQVQRVVPVTNAAGNITYDGVKGSVFIHQSVGFAKNST